MLNNCVENATWIETGTYKGSTTAFLSQHSPMVYSIEPEPMLCANATKRFLSVPNIKILCGTSEEVFPDLFASLSGSVNLWLDGHYSAGETFQGENDTSINIELETISKHAANFEKISIMIDDVRCFRSNAKENDAYPSLDSLVDWARKNDFLWNIELDIFIAQKGIG